MNKSTRQVVNVGVLLGLLGAGLWVGPKARAAYDRGFSEPAYVVGDFSALHVDTGKPVVIFTASTCPHCKRAVALLRREHVDYHEFVIDQSSEAEKRYGQLDQTGVPVLVIGNREIVGYDEDAILESLRLPP